MVSPLLATLPCRQGPPAPSMTLPLAINRSASSAGGPCAASLGAASIKASSKPVVAAGAQRQAFVLGRFDMGTPGDLAPAILEQPDAGHASKADVAPQK